MPHERTCLMKNAATSKMTQTFAHADHRSICLGRGILHFSHTLMFMPLFALNVHYTQDVIGTERGLLIFDIYGYSACFVDPHPIQFISFCLFTSLSQVNE